MPLNAVLAYLGMLGLLVGGLGLAYEVAIPRPDARQTPAEITASVPSTPAPAGAPAADPSASAETRWPIDPRHAAVPFNEQMLELLTPQAQSPEPEPQTASAPAEPDMTVGVGTREPQRDIARERVREKKQRKAKAKIEAGDTEDTVEVEVQDPSGRRIRAERVPRERVERTAREERQEEPRQYRRGFDGVERRGFGFPLFNLFGGGRGDGGW